MNTLFPAWLDAVSGHYAKQWEDVEVEPPESTSQDLIAALQQCLDEAHRLADLRKSIADLDIVMPSDVAYSRLIARHMMEHAWDMEELLEFLADPDLNSAGSRNYKRVVDFVVKNGVSLEVQERLFDIIQGALGVGLLAEEEIRYIVRTARYIKLGDRRLMYEAPRILHCHYLKMWAGIKSCTILGPHDLKERVLSDWAQFIVQTDLTSVGCSVLSMLLQHLPTGSMVSNHVHRFLADWTIKSEIWQDSARLDQDIQAVRAMLRSWPGEFAAEQVVRTTEQLVVKCMEMRPTTTRPWRTWSAIVSGLGTTDTFEWSGWTILQLKQEALGVGTVEPVSFAQFPRAKNKKTSASGGKQSSDTRDPRKTSILNTPRQLLVRLWTIKALSAAVSMDSNSTLARTRVVSALIHQLEHCSNSISEDALTALLFTIHDLRAPYIGLLEFIVPYLRSSQPSESFVKALDDVERGSLSLNEAFLDDSMYVRLKKHIPEVLNSMSSGLNIYSDDFNATALSLIQTDKRLHRIVFRVLRRNTFLKTNLSQSWIEGPLAAARAGLNVRAAPGPLPGRSLQLMHTLATAFACSPVVSPRGALRRVYWCYKFVEKHNGPLRPEMTRAIYHAGITRYRDVNRIVDAAQIEWVMGLVRKVEGQEVADHLRWHR